MNNTLVKQLIKLKNENNPSFDTEFMKLKRWMTTYEDKQFIKEIKDKILKSLEHTEFYFNDLTRNLMENFSVSGYGGDNIMQYHDELYNKIIIKLEDDIEIDIRYLSVGDSINLNIEINIDIDDIITQFDYEHNKNIITFDELNFDGTDKYNEHKLELTNFLEFIVNVLVSDVDIEDIREYYFSKGG